MKIRTILKKPKAFRMVWKGNSWTIKNLMVLLVLVSTVIFTTSPITKTNQEAQAASTNLIINSSFENNIETNWSTWKDAASQRTYTLVRSYDAPFGYGSYSASIEATGQPGGRFSAGMVSADSGKFLVEANKNYFLSFYAKASANTKISVFLEKASNYEATSLIEEQSLTTEWQKYYIKLTPNFTGETLLSVVFGDMPQNSTLYIDGLNLFENNLILNTKEVKGYIGDKDKTINITNIYNFPAADIKIELPYYNEQTNIVETKKLSPKKIENDNIYIDLNSQTFPGIGRVYALDELVGQFNYNITPRITEFNPSLVRVDEDLVIYGSGFNPRDNETFVIVNTIDTNGVKHETWIKPHTVDPLLSQITIKLPVGIANGVLKVYTHFTTTDGKDVANYTNTMNYNIKPTINKSEWSKRGYDQVGDMLSIYGKGIADKPTVYFYDGNNKLIISTAAKVKEINTETNQEKIEVATPVNISNMKVTVKVGSYESDQEEALSYTAKPKLISIKSQKNRSFNENKSIIAAAKAGEEIQLNGEGFKNAASNLYVEFQGIDTNRIKIQVAPEKIDTNGKWLKIFVPAGAQNGYINIEINNEKSNYLPMEIIPTIMNISPEKPVPGEKMIITAQGVGRNINLTKINFKLTNNSNIIVSPDSITSNGSSTVITVVVPMAISNKYSSINLQYDKWQDDQSFVLNTTPHILSASMNKDSKILSIKGYGFSINPSENKITYRYADAEKTIIKPRATILGVYPTEEGQEIKIKIADNYYYGSVSVNVGGLESNEAAFGPASITKIARRVQFVSSENAVMGVLYISGYNFGTSGDVKVGDIWAKTHYRTNYFIIAVVNQQDLYKNPVVITKK